MHWWRLKGPLAPRISDDIHDENGDVNDGNDDNGDGKDGDEKTSSTTCKKTAKTEDHCSLVFLY